MAYKCPNGCVPEVDTPFYVPTCCLPDECEIGFLVYPDLTLSNRWQDGTVGISDELRDWYDHHDCLPHCVECSEEIVEVKS